MEEKDEKMIPETENAVEEGVHNYSRADRYVPPKEEAVKAQLEWFQDQKIALMMHWGIYSQWGVVESWALSDEDTSWCRERDDFEFDDKTFKEQYFALNKTFNPVRFRPEKWAEEAANAGFKYVVFTTKHHDGFCMWDSKYSDYKITSPDCPFHTNKNANVVKVLFDEMRKKGLGIAAYFSKADWHVPCYWTKDGEMGEKTWRGPSYDPAKNPKKWEEFREFTKNQIIELVRDYGKIDVLWFDAGWVCKESGEDIRLGEIVDEARRIQPWVLSADRTVGGPYENYVTPEQCVPDEPLGIPWESCITMGTSFSFKYEDKYKTPRELACLLMDIVVKGGNLALNVGPQPDGRLPEGALVSMRGLGEWLRVFGEGIYGTRVCAPYKKDGIYFTQKKKGNTVFAFKMYENENDEAGKEFFVPLDMGIESVARLEDGEEVKFEKVDGGYRLTCKTKAEGHPIATAFKIKVSA
jgi:alpha-L-fucosidase